MSVETVWGCSKKSHIYTTTIVQKIYNKKRPFFCYQAITNMYLQINNHIQSTS